MQQQEEQALSWAETSVMMRERGEDPEKAAMALSLANYEEHPVETLRQRYDELVKAGEAGDRKLYDRANHAFLSELNRLWMTAMEAGDERKADA